MSIDRVVPPKKTIVINGRIRGAGTKYKEITKPKEANNEPQQ